MSYCIPSHLNLVSYSLMEGTVSLATLFPSYLEHVLLGNVVKIHKTTEEVTPVASKKLEVTRHEVMHYHVQKVDMLGSPRTKADEVVTRQEVVHYLVQVDWLLFPRRQADVDLLEFLRRKADEVIIRHEVVHYLVQKVDWLGFPR